MTSPSRSEHRSEQWFPYNAEPVPDAQVQMRLFCFPYAGGRAAAYHTWTASLPPEIEVVPVELPGRGRRISESPFRRLSPLLSSLLPVITPWLDKPFAFFGHSMGGVISFELAHYLRETITLRPAHLFISGCRPPHMQAGQTATYDLPDDVFIQHLRRLQGTPEAVLQTPELLDLLLPVLRADFELYETYRYEARSPLACPLSVFGGRQDRVVTQEQLAGWKRYTTGPFTRRLFPGGHFYMRTNEEALQTHVRRALLPEIG